MASILTDSKKDPGVKEVLTHQFTPPFVMKKMAEILISIHSKTIQASEALFSTQKERDFYSHLTDTVETVLDAAYESVRIVLSRDPANAEGPIQYAITDDNKALFDAGRAVSTKFSDVFYAHHREAIKYGKYFVSTERRTSSTDLQPLLDGSEVRAVFRTLSRASSGANLLEDLIL